MPARGGGGAGRLELNSVATVSLVDRETPGLDDEQERSATLLLLDERSRLRLLA
jgi:hypothetical protein